MYIILVLMIIVVVIGFLGVRYLETKKLIMRQELRQHIIAILDPNGCENGMQRFHSVNHIVNYEGIPLKEVTYEGSMSDLKTKAYNSVELYKTRMEAEEKKHGEKKHGLPFKTKF